MKFDKWNNSKNQPKVGTQFVAKVKGKDEFIFGTILSENGWTASSFFKDTQERTWDTLKEMIDCWYDVKKIGQE